MPKGTKRASGATGYLRSTKEVVALLIKHIILLLAVALLLVAMVAASAAPAFAAPPSAKNQGKGQPVLNQGGNCPTGLQSGNQGAQNKCDKIKERR